MDGSRFDSLTRSFALSRRLILGSALAAGLSALAGNEARAKKKKKTPCAKACKDGCCTTRFGKCIKPNQQNSTRCGADGEICRTNCGGGRCGAGCNTCCAAGECLDEEQISNEQCGINGETCFACPPGQTCNAPGEGCCARLGAACSASGAACCDRLGVTCGPNHVCCVENGHSCSQTTDCCDDLDICDGGFCARQRLQQCTPGTILCQTPLNCTTVGNIHRCCAANGADCSGDQDCCEDEDICQDGICKRNHGDICDDTIICRSDYPYCNSQACRRCPPDLVSTGTDELCCPPTRYCPNANGGRGACCANDGCCVPDEDGTPCGKLEFPGLQSCVGLP